jgi:N-acetylglucosaminyl-diphospho-decaprenol L-rhamnosyltransferase
VSVEPVAVVVVTYNSLRYLERCLESVRQHAVVVVDHGSADGTVEYVQREFPHVVLIRARNSGFAAGNNRGIAALQADYFLLLNPDAWVEPAAVAKMLAFLSAHRDVAAVGPRLSTPDGRLEGSILRYPTMWWLVSYYLFPHSFIPDWELVHIARMVLFRYWKVRDVQALSGACMLVRNQAIRDVGGLDESFGMYFEDADWCFRFRAAGWRVVYLPSARGTHVGGGSTGDAFGVSGVGRALDQSCLRFRLKHYGERRAEISRWLLIAAYRARGVLLAGDRGRRHRGRAKAIARRLDEILSAELPFPGDAT